MTLDPSHPRIESGDHGYVRALAAIVLVSIAPLASPVAAATTELLIAPAGEAPNDFFGKSVASAGDVNGDGFDDVIVGAESAESTGRAYIYYGGPV